MDIPITLLRPRVRVFRYRVSADTESKSDTLAMRMQVSLSSLLLLVTEVYLLKATGALQKVLDSHINYFHLNMHHLFKKQPKCRFVTMCPIFLPSARKLADMTCWCSAAFVLHFQ